MTHHSHADRSERMKADPDNTDEVHDVTTFTDGGANVITPVMLDMPPEVSLYLTERLAGLVQAAHSNGWAMNPNADGITRAQVFEEGDVFMLEAPFDGYFADRYLMDFYDVDQRDICSRMHLHTGLRFVRMMTGPDTVIRVSSLSPFRFTHIPGLVDATRLATFTDLLPDTPDGQEITRYNAVVPSNAWVDMQVPRGTSHQFNAIGPNAVIDSVHPEESIETFREQMSGFRMMAQTIFLAEELPAAETCHSLPT